MNSVYLHGSEEVRRAASDIRQAAEDMRRAGAHIDESLRMHQQFLQQWLAEFRECLEKQRGEG